MKYGTGILLVFWVFFAGAQISAQGDSTKIRLINADEQIYSREFDSIQRLIGHVAFVHQGTYLYCDSAHMQNDQSFFDGYRNVRIIANDSVTIYADQIHYDTQTKIADLRTGVRLVSNHSTLYTDELFYNRASGIAYYLQGGKIVDTTNVLTSNKAYYYTSGEYAYFKDSVVLTNPNYRMLSDTLRYDPNKELSNFYGPTYIFSDENTIYCENGWYNSAYDRAQFNRNAYLISGNSTLRGDSLFYDRKRDYGEAFDNVSLLDTVKNMLIEGHTAYLYNKEGYAFVTDHALASLIDREDTLFLHSDTLFVEFDSTQSARLLTAYYKARFYREDIQGFADSLVYSIQDSVMHLYHDPIMWSGDNQLSSDSILLVIAHGEMDSINLYRHAMIISVDDTSMQTYNQIQGNTIVGHFHDNEITRMDVLGNARSIYFLRDDADSSLIGINVTDARYFKIYIRNRKIRGISNFDQVEGKIYPWGKLKKEDMRIKGFFWKENLRPRSKNELFDDAKYAE